MSESNGTIKEYYIKPEINKNIIVRGTIEAYSRADHFIDGEVYHSVAVRNEIMIKFLCTYGNAIAYFQISPDHD